MFNTKKPDTIIPSSAPTRPVAPAQRSAVDTERESKSVTIISKECHIKGVISGNDDISVCGKVEGEITLKNNTVTIENSAKVDANILAKVANINGNIVGNIEATDKILITGSGNVTGDMVAKKVILQDGSYFKGNVSMIDNQPSQGQTTSKIKK